MPSSSGSTIGVPTALVLSLCVAACQPQRAEVAPANRCAVPRIAASFEQLPPASRPADEAPRAGVLPTPALSDAEGMAAGDCIRPLLLQIAAGSDNAQLRGSTGWTRVSTQFYRSEHGRYIEVAVNPLAVGYLRFEDGPPLPVGAVIKKHSFRAFQSGAVRPGPQFLAEKMPPGYDPRVGDWKFTLIGDTGTTVGETRGRDGDKVEYCVECHKSAWRQNFLFFVPPDYRQRN